MGMILKKKLEDGSILGIWEITEDINILLDQVKLSDTEFDRYNRFLSHARKLEFLSVRALLGKMLNPDVKIVYNGNRKPYLDDGSYNISITHSKSLTSILLNKTKRVGIDLEYMSHRIRKIAHKFINDNESINKNDLTEKYHLYIHWCAKEALYKVCDKKDINFRLNLFIKPFPVNNKGVIKGNVNSEMINEEFDLNYFKYDNYIIVYTSKD
ncbi:MAG: 4'-phosphopantetheinyl transferase superfamily protein [Bacteroidetes bacterium]|nr:4'-phosphopantetheinyl transferase superfamily protein [Bacteroidota bacterium]